MKGRRCAACYVADDRLEMNRGKPLHLIVGEDFPEARTGPAVPTVPTVNSAATVSSSSASRRQRPACNRATGASLGPGAVRELTVPMVGGIRVHSQQDARSGASTLPCS